MPWDSFLLLSVPSGHCLWLLRFLQVIFGAASPPKVPPEGLLYTCPKSDPDSPSEMLVSQLWALELMSAWGDVSSGVRKPFMGSCFGMGLLMGKQKPLDLRRYS